MTTQSTRQIHATVTPYEGDAPGPRDWSAYVADRLSDLFPGYEVSVSYGNKNAAYKYTPSTPVSAGIEDMNDFRDLCEDWWTDLCADSDHEQWAQQAE